MSRPDEGINKVKQPEPTMASSAPPNGPHKITVYLRAGAHPELTADAAPHEELANLGNDYASLRYFKQRWGELIPPVRYEQPPPDFAGGAVTAPAPPPVEDLAEKFGEELAGKIHQHSGGGIELQYRDVLREAWRGDENALLFVHDYVARHSLSTWEFGGGRIEIVPDNLWITICILFLRDRAAGRLGLCANPGCASPYFLKLRRTQRLCMAGPCTAWAQRLRAFKWWDEKGRKKKRSKKSKPRRARR